MFYSVIMSVRYICDDFRYIEDMANFIRKKLQVIRDLRVTGCKSFDLRNKEKGWITASSQGTTGSSLRNDRTLAFVRDKRASKGYT